ncbi:MAG: GAF domain-containing protein [Anaerolineae bacterium]|nr:GAF domain-containing protein [Anaerolineae bacterium]
MSQLDAGPAVPEETPARSGVPNRRGGMWRRFRLYRRQSKIIALAFIPAALILGAVALVNFFAYRQTTAEMAMERDAQLVKMAAVQLGAELEGQAAPLLQVARVLGVTAEVAELQQAPLERAAATLAAFNGGVVLLDRNGAIVASQPRRPTLLGQDWSGQPFFQQARDSMQTRTSDLLVVSGPETAPLYATALAVPVVGPGGEFRGVIAGFYELGAATGHPFGESVLNLPLSAGRAVYLVDGRGQLLYHVDAARIGEGYGALPAVAALLAQEEGALRTVNDAGEPIVAAYAVVPGTSWGLVTEEAWSALVAPYASYQNLMLLLLVLGLLVPAVVVVAGVRRLMRPLQTLITATQEVARGQFGGSVALESGDEMETLAYQFNLMSAELAASYEQLEMRLAARTRELAAMNAIAAIVSHAGEPSEMLRVGLEEALAVMEIPAGGVYLLDETGHGLRLVAHRGLGESLVATGEALAGSQTFCARVVESGEPLLAQDLGQERPDALADADLRPFGAFASFPLRASGRVLGAYFVLGTQPRPFSDADVELLTSIGQQMGVALENAYLLQQIEQAATQEERQRLARELHDAVTQTLFSASLIAEVLPELWEKDEALARQRLADLHALNRGALAEMRTLLLELRPVALVESNLPELLQQLAAALRGRCQFEVALAVEGTPPAGGLPPEVQVAMYRIAQEALNNIAKHAAASRVEIQLAFGAAGVLLEIADDGRGFDAGAGRPDSFGLAIMHERAAKIGAELQIESAPGAGTRLSVLVPS